MVTMANCVKVKWLSDKYQRCYLWYQFMKGKRGQHFGQLKNAFIRAVDKGKELYPL